MVLRPSATAASSPAQTLKRAALEDYIEARRSQRCVRRADTLF